MTTIDFVSMSSSKETINRKRGQESKKFKETKQYLQNKVNFTIKLQISILHLLEHIHT